MPRSQGLGPKFTCRSIWNSGSGYHGYQVVSWPSGQLVRSLDQVLNSHLFKCRHPLGWVHGLVTHPSKIPDLLFSQKLLRGWPLTTNICQKMHDLCYLLDLFNVVLVCIAVNNFHIYLSLDYNAAFYIQSKNDYNATRTISEFFPKTGSIKMMSKYDHTFYYF